MTLPSDAAPTPEEHAETDSAIQALLRGLTPAVQDLTVPVALALGWPTQLAFDFTLALSVNVSSVILNHLAVHVGDRTDIELRLEGNEADVISLVGVQNVDTEKAMVVDLHSVLQQVLFRDDELSVLNPAAAAFAQLSVTPHGTINPDAPTEAHLDGGPIGRFLERTAHGVLLLLAEDPTEENHDAKEDLVNAALDHLYGPVDLHQNVRALA